MWITKRANENINNKMLKEKELKIISNNSGSSEKVELVHLALKPNEEIALHANPFDVIFYILEGNGTINFENGSTNVVTNCSIFIEKDKQRGMRNNSSSVFRVLVCKVF